MFVLAVTGDYEQTPYNEFETKLTKLLKRQQNEKILICSDHATKAGDYAQQYADMHKIKIIRVREDWNDRLDPEKLMFLLAEPCRRANSGGFAFFSKDGTSFLTKLAIEIAKYEHIPIRVCCHEKPDEQLTIKL